MDFDLATWKQAAAEKLRHIGRWLDRRKTDVPYLAYGTLCGLSLWPLVEAAQAGQTLPVMMALGSVAAGVGGNLIAEQVGRWKDQADPLDEPQVTRWVVEHAGDAELRAALDAILEKLDAIPQAQAGLGEADRGWFAEALKEELDRLGNLARFEATLIGSGAIAQDHGVAATTGAVAVGGDVKGDVITGGEHHHYHGPPSPDPDALREAYLCYVLEEVGHVTLAGVDRKTASEAGTRLNLAAVYTGLRTLTPQEHDRLKGDPTGLGPRDREQERLSVVDQLNRFSKLVLLGDPGSGKSTFVNFVAMCLTGQLLDRSEANLAQLTKPLPQPEEDDKEPQSQPWDHGALLPVRVVLRDFAARGLPPVGERATAKHLWDFVAAQLHDAALEAFVPHLAEALFKEGGLILLDGLDEVPAAEHRREQIKQAVENFAATFRKCRLLVTSRTYAYQQQAWRLNGFAEAVLAPFEERQIDCFIERWYAHIAPLRGLSTGDAEGQAELLKRAIRANDRLAALAARPLLLTLMASLHAWRGGSLPEKREQLYADAVDLLLDWWERPKVVRDRERVIVQQPSLAEWLRVDRDQVRALLERLAFQAHAAQLDFVGTADVPEGDLLSGLMRLSRNPEVNPARLVEYLSWRAGLLLPRGVGVYTFPHRTFQEYLAACYLTVSGFPNQVARLVRSDPNRWREVALLAGAKSARGAPFSLWALVEKLCPHDVAEVSQSAEDAWGALVAGRALVESADLEQADASDHQKLERVQAHQVRILESGQLPAVERTEAGRVLARLGDPRFRAEAWYLPDEPLLGFVEVPAGPFLMGTPEDDIPALLERYGGEQSWYKWEVPQHEVMLPAYYIARYPVTQAQFRLFVAAEGYQEGRYWREAEQTGAWQAGRVKRRWAEFVGDDIKEFEETADAPKDFGEPFNLSNHPVVGVTWYEALAYCRWLAEQLGAWEGLPELLARRLRQEGWRVRLPSEREWEKAARGGDGRVFPWGGEPDPNRANYSDTGVGSTSAVGCFPAGVSPYGCQDMSGNVWEWCATRWQESYKNYRDDNDPAGTGVRVLRGGAFLNPEDGVRCAHRDRDSPDNWYNFVGFRIVVAPG